MIAVIFSIAGLILFGLLNYFFVTKDVPRIGKIIWGLLSLVPFLGAAANAVFLSIGIFDHCLPYEDNIYEGRDLSVRDTKLNRWLFDDLEWEKYDTVQKFNSKYNTNKE